MEISEDGSNWNPWLTVTKSITMHMISGPVLNIMLQKQSPARYIHF